eukprot:TRINITY_DN49_c1_g1_i1.p1 TRINITY_DN49_c1_g1~~TRINITY_DN49_c1_g1_i1.p1  ORF type:complete len:205 (+),score=60.16 TRINITY_DN49_c1_g1_i1:212-826(+)
MGSSISRRFYSGDDDADALSSSSHAGDDSLVAEEEEEDEFSGFIIEVTPELFTRFIDKDKMKAMFGMEMVDDEDDDEDDYEDYEDLVDSPPPVYTPPPPPSRAPRRPAILDHLAEQERLFIEKRGEVQEEIVQHQVAVDALEMEEEASAVALVGRMEELSARLPVQRNDESTTYAEEVLQCYREGGDVLRCAGLVEKYRSQVMP